MASARKITKSKAGKNKAGSKVWQNFLGDGALLKKNQVTDEELEILQDFSPLGVLTGSGDLLFILDKIRWARDKKPAA
jgi:hypothetical protein